MNTGIVELAIQCQNKIDEQEKEITRLKQEIENSSNTAYLHKLNKQILELWDKNTQLLEEKEELTEKLSKQSREIASLRLEIKRIKEDNKYDSRYSSNSYIKKLHAIDCKKELSRKIFLSCRYDRVNQHQLNIMLDELHRLEYIINQ